MGGTFDPIHHGHLVAASEVQSWFGLSEVVYVGPVRSMSTRDTQNRGLDAVAMTVIR
jgi:nicotinate-nucleotide adenylyltransferase